MLNFKYAIIPSLTLKELPKISMEQLLEEKKKSKTINEPYKA